MRILVIEHLSASPSGSSEDSLGDEGFAMLRTLYRDLSREPGVEAVAAVHSKLAARCREMQIHSTEVRDDSALLEAAASFDGVLLIAPEINGVAVRWAKRLEEAGASLLSPSSAFISWACDKLKIAKSLPAIFPATLAVGDPIPQEWGDELVLKPRIGTGALYAKFTSRSAVDVAVGMIREEGFAGDLIVQPRIQGRKISVSVVAIGSRPSVVLPAFEQVIESESRGATDVIRQIVYRGGVGPFVEFRRRVGPLVETLLRSATAVRGWFGVDLILADDGRDVVVDVNPRLTTSYIGYSSLFPGIPAKLLLGRETSEDAEALHRDNGRRIRFDAAGYVEEVVGDERSM